MASAEYAVQQNIAAGLLAGSVTRDRRARWWRRTGSKSRGFRYETADGRALEDEAALERIKSLVIPPAWGDVRISPSPRSSLQAIGVDKAGRVQRIYHPSFVARRARRKYEKTERFGKALPGLRRRTNEDIAREGLGKERVLAVVVRLINDLYFRVGSEESVKRYRTYGVTTLRNRHLEIGPGGRLIFKFTGKHHIKHRRILVDEELAALVRDIKSIGGAKLFEYVGEDGKVRAVTPRDVNDYIKAAAGRSSRRRTFARGAGRFWRPSSWPNSVTARTGVRRRGTWWRPSSAWPSASATRRPSAAPATYTPRCSKPTSADAPSKSSARAVRAA